jgi:hypothetical protein
MSRTRISYQERCLESLAKNPYDLPFVIVSYFKLINRPVLSSGLSWASINLTISTPNMLQMYSCESKKNGRKGPASADESVSEASSCWINLQLRLAGTVGVPKGHPSATEQIQFNIQIHGSSSQCGGSAHSSSTPGHSADNKSSSPSSVGSQRTMHTEVTDDDNVVWPLREACTFRKPIYIAQLGDRAKGFETRGWPDQTRSAV